MRALTDHEILPEAARLENALNIWVRDLREQELAKVRKGGRLSVPALAYEEVLRLRGIINKGLGEDRKRRIQGRWDRRRARRLARADRVMHGLALSPTAADAIEFGSVAWRLRRDSFTGRLK